jgi:hypothetical protein
MTQNEPPFERDEDLTEIEPARRSRGFMTDRRMRPRQRPRIGA